MLNPDSTQGPGLAAQKSDTQAPPPTIPPAKPRPWQEYDLPAENVGIASKEGESLAPDPAPNETALASPPQKRRLYWSWNFTLVIGGEEWPPNKGHHFEEFHNNPKNVTAFLRRCDSWFNSAIPEYIEGHVRRCILEEVAKVPDPGEIQKTEVPVQLVYDIRAWEVGERPYKLKGTKEHAIKLDRQVRGHITAVKWAYEQGVFRFVRAEFRHLAASWIEKLPSSAARENALKQIKRELYQIVGPDMVAEDQLPPAIQDIEIANPDNAD